MHEVAPYVLTLIAPAGSVLNVPQLVSNLPTAGNSVWLNDRAKYATESTALDVFLTREPTAAEHKAIVAACHAGHLDFILQPTAHREKKLLISDMDSTMIGQECIDEMAEKLGIKSEVQAITKQSMGDVKNDFKTSVRTRVGMVKGLALEQLQDIFEHIIKPNPGAHTLIATMNARGATTHLVSGGFTFFSHRVGNLLGFTTHNANELGIEGLFTNGEIEGDIIDGAAKKELLAHYAQQRGLDMRDTLAVGDGSNDVPMIQAAGLGIAYHAASDAVREKAHASITHNDLTALLYAQGIARSQWVEREAQQSNGKGR